MYIETLFSSDLLSMSGSTLETIQQMEERGDRSLAGTYPFNLNTGSSKVRTPQISRRPPPGGVTPPAGTSRGGCPGSCSPPGGPPPPGPACTSTPPGCQQPSPRAPHSCLFAQCRIWVAEQPKEPIPDRTCSLQDAPCQGPCPLPDIPGLPKPSLWRGGSGLQPLGHPDHCPGALRLPLHRWPAHLAVCRGCQRLLVCGTGRCGLSQQWALLVSQ